MFGIELSRLLLDNVAAVPSLDDLAPGSELLVCGATRNAPDTLAAQFAAPRPPVVGPARPGNAAGETGGRLAMFNSLRPFDGRSLYLTHGPITKVRDAAGGVARAAEGSGFRAKAGPAGWQGGRARAPLGVGPARARG
jgi:hypothetical protein